MLKLIKKPKLNRTKNAIPDEFYGQTPWGPVSERSKRYLQSIKPAQRNSTLSKAVNLAEKTVSLFLHVILITPKNSTDLLPTRSFGLLLEREIKEPPEIEVHLHTKEVDIVNRNYDAVATFLPQGNLKFSFEAIEKIKRAHAFLYKLLTRARVHPERLMDPTYAMFLVVPVEGDGEIDWWCIGRVFFRFCARRWPNFVILS